MMVMTAKVNLKKAMIALAAVAALIVALILLLGGGGDSAETSAPTASSLSLIHISRRSAAFWCCPPG